MQDRFNMITDYASRILQAYAREAEGAPAPTLEEYLLVRQAAAGEMLYSRPGSKDDAATSRHDAPSMGAPHIASISFIGVRAEVMLHSLEEEGIYVSAGSACSSNKKRESSVLSAIGLPADQRESTLRFSFSEENTEEEVRYVVETVGKLLPTLRHYTRG